MRSVWVLLFALGLDRLLGDPWDCYHPVQAMGWLIAKAQGYSLAVFSRSQTRRLTGGLLTALLLLGSYGYAWGLIAIATAWRPWAGLLVEVILTASCLGARSLRRAAEEVVAPLLCRDLPRARHYLSRYVGRDTDLLSEAEICRAVIETVAENTPDGATAPLFYAVLGGAPLAFAYKAASTLDSMLGYRKPPFTDIGLVPAKLEDLLTWLPCRLTVATIALLQRHPWQFWQRCRTQARLDPSPNSGWSEAAFAWSIGVQLGGRNWYQAEPRDKPLLGSAELPLSPATINASLRLMRRVMLIWSAIALIVRPLLIYAVTSLR